MCVLRSRDAWRNAIAIWNWLCGAYAFEMFVVVVACVQLQNFAENCENVQTIPDYNFWYNANKSLSVARAHTLNIRQFE